MFDILNEYTNKGHFYFCSSDKLVKVCNAPTDRSGVYIVKAVKGDTENLLYIGCSGKKDKNTGEIIHRTCGLGGIKDRLVNGHQFGAIPRKKIWPQKMKELGLEKLSIYWYDTNNDNPEYVESKLLSEFKLKNGVLPPWNKEEPKGNKER